LALPGDAMEVSYRHPPSGQRRNGVFNAESEENAEVKEEARESMSNAKVRQAWKDILPRMRAAGA